MESDGRNGDPQPFTSDELENYNGDWSLSCDMRLLSNFKSLSGTMFDRAEQVLASIDDIVFKTEEKAVKVSNVVNDLQMLATNQFIENRVYEESEETHAAASDVPEPTAGIGDQQNIVSKIRSSLNQGMEFVRHNVPDVDVEEDSDEEDNIRSSLRLNLRQHKFLTRKLPPLVGGHEFSRENFVSLFRSRYSPEVITDAVDALNSLVQDDDLNESDRDSEADIVMSSSDSDDMFMPTGNKPSILNAALQSKSANLFSDSSSPEADAVTESVTRVLSSNPLSLQDELSRRLLDDYNQKQQQQESGQNSDAAASFSPIQTEVKHFVTESPHDASSSSSGAGSAFRDRLNNLFANPNEVQPSTVPKVPQKSIKSSDHDHQVTEHQSGMKQQQPLQKPVGKSVPASRKLLDFLSDDDDDEFNIFKAKPSQAAAQSAKVSKLFSESEDSASDTERSNDRKAALPAKDSDFRRGPEKEVGDARRSETRRTVATVNDAPEPRITTASRLFEGDASSEDDLFSSKVVQLPSDPQTSINTSAKSHVKQDTQSPKDIPDKRAALTRNSPDSSDDSDSSHSPVQMNRSAIASKLEKTIFGPKSRKPPAGAISMFGDATSAKKTSKEPDTNEFKEEPSVPQTSELEGKVISVPQQKKVPTIIDDDVLASDVLNTSVTTLSSLALKSRPRVQNRRKPTRAAVKSVKNETTAHPMGETPDINLSAEEVPHFADSNTPDRVIVAEARNAATIKLDASDSGSIKPLPDKKQIPPSEPLEAGNPNPVPDSSQNKESSNKTAAVPVKKSILFDDSDEDLFVPTRQQVTVPTASAIPTLKQHSKTDSRAKTKNKGLFSDSEDDDMFSVAKKNVTPSANNSSVKADHSLFNFSDEESSPSMSADKTTAKADQERGSGATTVVTSVAQKATSDKKQNSSLFSEDSDDDDDLFKSKHK